MLWSTVIIAVAIVVTAMSSFLYVSKVVASCGASIVVA